MTAFPYSCTIDVRYRDIDAANHVNNAVVVTYLENARVLLWRDRFRFSGQASEIPFVVARVAIDYRSPIALGEVVTVALGVTRVGTTSFTLAYRLEASGRLVAEAESVQVQVDLATGLPMPLPDEMRALLGSITIPSPAGGR